MPILLLLPPLLTKKMRTISLDSCGRELEKDPKEERREQLFAKLCAIKDDDTAARAFHYHRSMQECFDKHTTLWMPRLGLHLPDGMHVAIDGIQFSLEPGVKPEAILLDQNLDIIMGCIKDLIVKSVDGTGSEAKKKNAEEEEMLRLLDDEAGKMKPQKHHVYDPTWFPSDGPTVQELYPFGYFRHADGTVEANKQEAPSSSSSFSSSSSS